MKKRIIFISLLYITTLVGFTGCAKAEASIDCGGPIFSEFEFGMTKSTITSMYPDWAEPVTNTEQVLVFEEVDYKGFYGSIMFGFDPDDHTLMQINLYLLPKEENSPEKFNASVAIFNKVYGQPDEMMDDYYAYWTFKYGEDDAVLLIIYDQGVEEIETYLMYEHKFPSLYELL